MTFKPSINKTVKKTGLAALLEQANAEALTVKPKEQKFEYKPSTEATHRIRVVFDDSGSMSGQAIEDAQDGCVEFMKNCIPNETALAIHPMNYRSRELDQLTTNLPQLSILVKEINATNYTPLFETWQRAIEKEPKATRFIIFSDGSPDTRNGKEECINFCIENKIPCDTVYIGRSSIDEDHIIYGPAALMKEIADRTGGIFLVFERGKVNFAKAFKYLAPGLRLQLVADVQMQRDLQDGKLA